MTQKRRKKPDKQQPPKKKQKQHAGDTASAQKKTMAASLGKTKEPTKPEFLKPIGKPSLSLTKSKQAKKTKEKHSTAIGQPEGSKNDPITVSEESPPPQESVPALAPPESSAPSSSYRIPIGMQNLSALACYVNAMIQSLFHTNELRQHIYDLYDRGDRSKVITNELMRLFASLQRREGPPNAKLLMEVWPRQERTRQHDVVEFKNTLFQALMDENEENIFFSDFYERAFVIQTTETRSNGSHDVNRPTELQLPVGGFERVQDSLEDYILEKDVEGSHLTTQTTITAPPRVLNLQLNRLVTDRDAAGLPTGIRKDSSRFEFPEQLDLTDYVEPRGEHHYILHSVIIHMGSTTAGHYYLFVKPGRNESWYKIDDERVEPCSFDLVQQEGYGTGVADEPSAYLLVYIRADSYDQLLADVDLSGYTPPETIEQPQPVLAKKRPSVPLRPKKPQPKSVRGAEQPAVSLMNVTVLTIDTFRSNRRFGFVTLCDARVQSSSSIAALKVDKNKTYVDFLQDLESIVRVSRDKLRLWTLDGKPSADRRTRSFLSAEKDADSTMQSLSLEHNGSSDDFWLYMEISHGKPADDELENGKTLVFVKHFYTGHYLINHGCIFVDEDQTIISSLQLLVEDQKDCKNPIFYQELYHDARRLNESMTYKQGGIRHGDIICVHMNPYPDLLSQVERRLDLDIDFPSFVKKYAQVVYLDISGQRLSKHGWVTAARLYEENVQKLHEHIAMALETDVKRLQLHAVDHFDEEMALPDDSVETVEDLACRIKKIKISDK